jgi:hypothetical protein
MMDPPTALNRTVKVNGFHKVWLKPRGGKATVGPLVLIVTGHDMRAKG